MLMGLRHRQRTVITCTQLPVGIANRFKITTSRTPEQTSSCVNMTLALQAQTQCCWAAVGSVALYWSSMCKLLL
jgi:hypothetical protein